MAEKMSELKKNITAYEKMGSEWIVEHTGKIALLSDGKLIDIFNDLSDAYKVGIQ